MVIFIILIAQPKSWMKYMKTQINFKLNINSS